MQNKLTSAYRSGENVGGQRQTADRLSNIGLGGNMSKPSMEAYTKATQSARKEMDLLIAAEARRQEVMGKNIGQREQLLKKLKADQTAAVGDADKELKIREKIARVEENIYKQREHYKQRDQTINQAIDARQKMYSGVGDRAQDLYSTLRTKGAGAAAKQGIGMMGGGMAAGAAILGATGQAINFGTDVYEQLGRSPFRTKLNTGAAMESTAGRTMEDMQSVYGQMWGKERGRAAQDAARQNEISRNADKARIASGSALIGGGAMGMAAGAGMSGTIVGLPAGLVAGGVGLGAMATGAGRIFGNERTRSLATSGLLSSAGSAINESGIGKMTGGMFGAGNWLKGQGDQQMKQYNSILAKEFADNFQSALQAEQQTNPLKKLAGQTYQQNYMRDLGTQRSLGLNYDSFHGAGGFRERGINAGFTEDMMTGMSQGILGAGGSTRMGRQSELGLQMQRGLNMTNASQILGTVSGSMGDAGATKNATIKILAEGMKLGLDDSKFAEENRRFTQAVADVVAKSGTKTAEGAESAAAGFGRFVGEKTNAGIEAAQGAYQRFQAISSETTGPRGVMRAAAFLSDPLLSKLSTIDKQSLMKVPEEDLTTDHPLVINAAEVAKSSPQAIIDSIKKGNAASVNRLPGGDKARNKIQAYMKSKNMEKMTEEDMQAAPQDIRSDFNQLMSAQTLEQGYKSRKDMESFAYGTINKGGVGAMGQKEREAAANAKLTGDTGKIEDKSVAALAENSRLALDSFKDFHKELVPTVDSIAKFNAQLKISIDHMKTMSPNGGPKFEDWAFKAVGVPSPETQDKAGRESK